MKAKLVGKEIEIDIESAINKSDGINLKMLKNIKVSIEIFGRITLSDYNWFIENYK
jgi:hypothetical protein